MNQYEQHQELRKQHWSKAWSAVAGAWNSATAEVATSWADKALAAFDGRFKAPDNLQEKQVAEMTKELEEARRTTKSALARKEELEGKLEKAVARIMELELKLCEKETKG